MKPGFHLIIKIILIKDDQPQYLSRNEQFDQENVFETKISTKNSSKKFNCLLCEKTFQYKRGLTEHIKEKHSNIEYSCDKCEEVFTKANNLSRHVREVHSAEKNFQCELCKLFFSYVICVDGFFF